MRAVPLVVLVLCVAGALAWWVRGDAPRSFAPAPPHAPIDGPRDLTSPLGTDAPPEAERHAVVDDPTVASTGTPPSELAGTSAVGIELVAVGPGAEVADRRVLLRAGPVGGTRADADAIELRSDADGRCRIEREGPLALYGVGVAGDAGRPSAGLALYDRFALPGDPVLLRVEVDAGVRLVGRVVDEEGRAVAGARVLAWGGDHFDPTSPPERETESDTGGLFELAHLRRRFHVVALADGLVCTRGLRGELAAGTSALGDLELVLGPPATVAGRVRGARGEPVAASLRIRSHWGSDERERTAVAGLNTFRPGHADAVTDAAGRFVLGPVPRMPANVRLESEVYGMRDLKLPLDGGEWTIDLEDGVVLSGQVLEDRGAPVAGAEVGWHADGAGYRSVRTDAAGRFTLRGLPELETSYLWVVAEGWAPWVREGIELESEVAPAPVVARLEPGHALSGRVVDGRGRGLPGVRVVLEGERTFERGYSTDAPDTWEHLAGRGELRTGVDGRFRFADLYAGEFAVRGFAYGDRHALVEARARTGTDDLVLEFSPRTLERVVLLGQVVDALAGMPVTSYTLTLNVPTPTGSDGSSRDVLDPEGRFRIALPRPQVVFLSVQAPGYATWQEDPTQRVEGDHVCDVRLLRERNVEVRLLEADGTPTGGSVRFADSRGRRVMVRQSSHLSTSELRVPSEGAPGVGLPADLLDATVQIQRGLHEARIPLDLRSDPGPVVELILPAREPEPEPFDIGFSVFSADRDVDVEDLMQRMHERRALVGIDGCEPFTGILSIKFLDARGAQLVVGRLEPTAEGYRSTWSRPYEGTGTEDVSPPEVGCLVSERVHGNVRSVRLEAHGHADRALSIDPYRPNGGLQRIVVLRR